MEIAGADGLSQPRPTNAGQPHVPGVPTPDAGAGIGVQPPQTAGGGPPAPPPLAPPLAAGGDSALAQIASAIESKVARTVETDVKDEIARQLADAGIAAGRTALAFASAARSGRLSGEVENTAISALNAIPEIGGALAFTARAGLLAAEHGPEVGAFVERLAPPGLKPLAAAARREAESIARALAGARSALDAGGVALDEVGEVAGAAAITTGRTDTVALGRLAMASYSVHRELMEFERNRAMFNRERLGLAAGAVVEDMASRLAAGLSQASGR